ncbi:MAG: thiamine-phosphate kinase [Methylophilaceae bacterium]|nr:MAG: thiamine-phosphate kinase [Methylophilaceae bacterium]
MSAEFNLIKQFFTRPTSHTDLGIGDDAALIQVSAGKQLVVSTDMSVVGTHFFQDTAPYNIGWKSLAVNISDMAAMGATPKWATLAIALPDVNEKWLKDFSEGFFACADRFNVDLIGGDTTRGTLNISVTIMGETSTGEALRRDNAQPGDDIWVSGHLGHAALALAHLQKKIMLDKHELDICLQALHQPQPRVSLGLALRGMAHSCIDISDGLLADLGHILKASNTETPTIGATLQLENMPCLPTIKARLQTSSTQQAILAGGDDYELCFTTPKNQREAIRTLVAQLDLNLTRIGEINNTGKLAVLFGDQAINITQLGYEHFAETA